jgi:hypothetical protein
MLIAYVTLDEVNLAVAGELAEECGAALFAIYPAEAAQNGSFDAVIYDLDHIPAEEREQIVAELLTCGPGTPLAVHSYNLDEKVSESLRKRGVAVFRRLDDALCCMDWTTNNRDRATREQDLALNAH